MSKSVEDQVREQCTLLDGEWVHVTEALKKFGAGDATSKWAWQNWNSFKKKCPSIVQQIRREAPHEYLKMENVLVVLAKQPSEFGKQAAEELQRLEQKAAVEPEKAPESQ